jgi:hypothetical protein
MNSKSNATYEDFKINVKIKISGLWISLMFCYVYGDIFGFFVPGRIKEIQAGIMGLGAITQGVLLGTSIALAIPSLMVFLSLILTPKVNRWVNIILGAVFILGPALTMQGSWVFYKFYSVVEMALSILIIWFAWTWPKANASDI